MVLDSFIYFGGFLFLRYDLTVTFPILGFWAASGASRDFSGWFVQRTLLYSMVVFPICLYSPQALLAVLRCAFPVCCRLCRTRSVYFRIYRTLPYSRTKLDVRGNRQETRTKSLQEKNAGSTGSWEKRLPKPSIKIGGTSQKSRGTHHWRPKNSGWEMNPSGRSVKK